MESDDFQPTLEAGLGDMLNKTIGQHATPDTQKGQAGSRKSKAARLEKQSLKISSGKFLKTKALLGETHSAVGPAAPSQPQMGTMDKAWLESMFLQNQKFMNHSLEHQSKEYAAKLQQLRDDLAVDIIPKLAEQKARLDEHDIKITRLE